MDNRFNKDIYDWTLKAVPGKWYSLENIKMDKQEFIEAIKFLIDCGERLEFNNDYTALRKEPSVNW